MAIIRNDIPHRRRTDTEKNISHPIESMAYEFIIRKAKWWFTSIYNPNNKHKVICCDSIDDIVNATNSEHVKNLALLWAIWTLICHVYMIGVHWMMYWMYMIWRTSLLPQHVSSQSSNQQYLMSFWQQATSHVINTTTGLSDFHHLVGFSTKLQFPRNHRNVIVYRSYKHLNVI